MNTALIFSLSPLIFTCILNDAHIRVCVRARERERAKYQASKNLLHAHYPFMPDYYIEFYLWFVRLLSPVYTVHYFNIVKLICTVF